MIAIPLADESGQLTPLPVSERIGALDVVRGVGLIGIFVMNVEFFNRPLAQLGQGLPAGLAGGDWLAAWLVYSFVQGKFWTLFSLLFGMGFAIMLRRASQARRAFLPAYLRRIAALAVFGMLHHVFIWGGDILFSYALGAAGLLLVLYARIRYFGLALMLLFALAWLPGLQWISQAEAPLAMLAVAACWLCYGWLDSRSHEPAQSRARNAGVVLYLFPFVLMTAFGVVDFLDASSPRPPPSPSVLPAARADANRAPGQFAAAPEKIAVMPPQMPEAQELQLRSVEETRVLSRGSYLGAVRLRARDFVDNAPDELGFAPVLVGMFLIGTWFVRSGVIEHSAKHLPLFRKLAWIGVSVGVGMGVLGSAIATASSPGLDGDPYVIASGLALMGNLPACLGYVSVIVLLLHTRAGFVLAALSPLGRMALSNYLLQSIVGSLFFYGYGFGYWGMGRGLQLVFVCVVIAAQLLFCRWWLARFRYGPMEWLWRAITYWQLPPMRLGPHSRGVRAQIIASA